MFSLCFCIRYVFGSDDRLFSDDELKWMLQRWIYRIDPKRVNEYGQVMGSDADAVSQKEKKTGSETKKNK